MSEGRACHSLGPDFAKAQFTAVTRLVIRCLRRTFSCDLSDSLQSSSSPSHTHTWVQFHEKPCMHQMSLQTADTVSSKQHILYHLALSLGLLCKYTYLAGDFSCNCILILYGSHQDIHSKLLLDSVTEKGCC